jgi:serine protease
MNSVNVVSDSFGHGVFDGYSIVVGHEYAEAVTDPDNFATVQDGWNDAQGNENGDKCAWTDLANVSMNNHTSFAVQPLWSNKAFDVNGNGCVRSAPTNPHAMPPVGITPPSVDVCMTTGICPPGVAAGQPMPVNMAYFGGKVQVNPKIYFVFWGWGEPGAFDHTTAAHPANDPDGAGALMTRFVAAIGGTSWGNISTQYYQSNYNGTDSNITNPKQELAGVWHDDVTPIHDNLSAIELAQEAARAVQHFNIANLANAQVVVAQPQKYNDAGFNQNSYCAYHDYTTPISYPGVTSGISFVNMPYVLNAAGSCGKDFVNPAPTGDLDGVTIVLGHEIAETLTDPGAESSAGQVQYGAWFDWQGWEIGDKCAWVGDGLQVPGAAFNMIGNDGGAYPVQTLWSNQSLNGVGYCSQGF